MALLTWFTISGTVKASDWLLNSIIQWRTKVGVGSCAKIPKWPLVPLTGFVCLQCKQVIPIIWQFLGRPNRPNVYHTRKSQIFPVISDEINYCRLVYTLFKKNLIF